MRGGEHREGGVDPHADPKAAPHGPATLVVDATYQCNARCSYCRWGDGRASERAHPPVPALCLGAHTLHAAGVGRVVLSGGEPLLHPELLKVIGHYAMAGIRDRIVITNGLLATRERQVACQQAGATGFAFSIDATEPENARLARGMTAAQIATILAHLDTAGRLAAENGLELTVNCVLSSANCDLLTIRALAQRVARSGASTLKFQPVFDDGYLGVHAPGLRLAQLHANVVRAIGEDARSWPIQTNAPSFFADLARVCEGHAVEGTTCGLANRTFVLQEGGLVVCPWIGMVAATGARDLPPLLESFHRAKATCATGPHCFCLQPREHSWGAT